MYPLFKPTHRTGANNTQAGLRGRNHPDNTGDDRGPLSNFSKAVPLQTDGNGITTTSCSNSLQESNLFHLAGDVAKSSSALSICHLPKGPSKTIQKKRSQHHSDKLSPATMPIKMIFFTPLFSEPDICPKSQVIHTLTWVILQTSFCSS